MLKKLCGIKISNLLYTNVLSKTMSCDSKPFIDIGLRSSTEDLVNYFSNQVHAKDHFGDERVDNSNIIEFIKHNKVTGSEYLNI